MASWTQKHEQIEILLVEDSETDVDLMREVMEDSKISNQLHRAKDGVEALDFLYRRNGFEEAPRPDLILLDLNMPRMGGQDVLKEIKSNPAVTDIPVVVLTSSKAEEDILKSYQLHCNCYVTKPLDIDQFAKIVREIENFWFAVVKLPASSRRG